MKNDRRTDSGVYSNAVEALGDDDRYVPETAFSVFDGSLRFWAARTPERVAFSLIGNEGEALRSVSFRELDMRARRIAKVLQDSRLEHERALLLFPQGLDFIEAFFGCLYAGVIAVPVAPFNSSGSAQRFKKITEDAGAAAIIGDKASLMRLRKHSRETIAERGIIELAYDALVAEDAAGFREPRRDSEAVALLQYTSGSTGDPKGVAVTHRNLLHNCRLISFASGGAPLRAVSWLPHYHDMGLIGGILYAVFAGGSLRLLSPSAVIARPFLWLQQISDMRATFTGAPNFAYQLCIDRIEPEQRSRLDLSSLRFACVGAEPVRAETILGFRDFFEPCGLRSGALAPCFGMAESTLIVTAGAPTQRPLLGFFDARAIEQRRVEPCDEADSFARAVAGCGRALPEMDVRVVDPDTGTPVGEGGVGEIWVSGPSVAKGYWERPAESDEDFANRLPGGDTAYLRTGDLGFVLDGEIFIAGRIKDVIIVRGRNLYPQDVEAAVERSHPAVCFPGAAAFGVEAEGQERLAVVVEIRRTHLRSLDFDAVRKAIRKAVLESHDVQVHTLILVPQRSILRTTSGKVRRSACRQAYRDNALSVIDVDIQRNDDRFDFCELRVPGSSAKIIETATAEGLRQYLYRALSARLGVDRGDLSESTELASLGLDSISRIQLVTEVGGAFGIELFLSELVACETLGALVERLSQAGNQDGPATNALSSLLSVSPEHAHDPFPLTSVQEAYWMGRQSAFELGDFATHGYVEIDIENLDVVRLAESWRTLVERHGMLRTVFLSDGQQRTLAKVPEYQIEVTALGGLSLEERGARLSQTREEMAHQVLSSEDWPLFDIRVSDLGETQRLHFSIDLLVADLSSLMLLTGEWKALYDGQSLSPAPAITFRDYVLAEKRFESSELFQRSQRYWLDRLGQMSPGPDLPLAKAPQGVVGGRFVRRDFRLEAEQYRSLKRRASAHGVTVAVALVAAYCDVLALWSTSARFTLNLTFMRRLGLHSDVDDLVGDFTSILPLAVDAEPEASFERRAAVIQRQLWFDLDHRWADGVAVLREFRRVSDSRRGFPVVFTYGSDLKAAGYDASAFAAFGELVYSVSQTPQVWLDHQVIDIDDALYLSWDALDELFPAGMIEDMFSAYQTLVTDLAENDAPWSKDCSVGIPAHQLARRDAVNETQGPCPHQLLFEPIYEAARQRPDAVAVIAADKTLTYRELWGTAQRVAEELRRLDVVRRGTLVAVLMEKGWEQPPAVMAIQMAGGAYLPVDPDLPRQRRDLLLENGGVSCVLTQSKVVERSSLPDRLPHICVDSCLYSASDIVPAGASGLGPEDLAYVIYTSGSTGMPKGVMIDHRGAMNTLVDINERFGVGPQDRVLALSALSFDLSVYDIFGVLGAGGTVVLPEHGRMKDPEHWLALMAAHEVTIWNSVPALLQLALEYAVGHDLRLCNALRLVLLSGDWIPTDLPDRLRQVARIAEPVISLGGATEASIWSIWHPIAPADAERPSIPYGQPLRNQTFDVLDASMRQRPVWVPGELYIGGVGLARGYWGDPEKTASRFVIDPRSRNRHYKTGDIGRYLPDGSIEFLGRSDSQVKIGGYRIELGEIEAVLRQHPELQDVLVAVSDTDGRRLLVAYVVPAASSELPTGDVEPASDGGITAPAERIAFKLQREGLRRVADDMPSVELDAPNWTEDEARIAYIRRQSYRTFQQHRLARAKFSGLMACLRSLPMEDALLPRFQYPSAGSLYPVQAYVYIKADRIEGIEAGLYYYQPDEHRLVLLSPGQVVTRDVFEVYGGGNLPVFDSSAFALFLIAKQSAIEPLYGSWSWDFCVLEAGYMGQLLMMKSPEFHIGLCPIGALGFERIREAFQLDSDHALVHGFLGGGIGEAQTRRVEAPSIQVSTDSLEDRLRRYVAQQLPEYMHPACFMALDSIPLSKNGKIDRAVLPSPSRESPKGAAKGLPGNDLEKDLSAIVSQVLGIQEPDTQTSLFELGGTSMDLVRIQVQVSQLVGREIPLVELLRRHTITALAAYLSEQDAQTAGSDVIQQRARARRSTRRALRQRQSQDRNDG